MAKEKKQENPNGREPFRDVFKRRLDEIERDALQNDLNITAICRGAKISRATPDRWRKRAPKTVEIIDDMETTLEKLKKKRKSDG